MKNALPFAIMLVIIVLGMGIIMSVQQSKVTGISEQGDSNQKIIQSAAIEKITASHILVETEEEAEYILAQLNEGVAFASLAMEHSTCPSGADGGNLGEFGRGAMVKAFEDAAFALDVGELSRPVQTQFGWHIILRTK